MRKIYSLQFYDEGRSGSVKVDEDSFRSLLKYPVPDGFAERYELKIVAILSSEEVYKTVPLFKWNTVEKKWDKLEISR